MTDKLSIARWKRTSPSPSPSPSPSSSSFYGNKNKSPTIVKYESKGRQIVSKILTQQDNKDQINNDNESMVRERGHRRILTLSRSFYNITTLMVANLTSFILQGATGSQGPPETPRDVVSGRIITLNFILH